MNAAKYALIPENCDFAYMLDTTMVKSREWRKNTQLLYDSQGYQGFKPKKEIKINVMKAN